MKKFALFLIAFPMVAVGYAQERTVYLNGGNVLDVSSKKMVTYNGYTSDRLIPTTRDTIDYILIVDNQSSAPLHFTANIKLDPIAGADTTVSVAVDYKVFENSTYASLISPVVTSAITAPTVITKTSLGAISNMTATFAADSTTTYVPNPVLYYRYIRFRLILQGNDSVGTGIAVKRIDLLFHN